MWVLVRETDLGLFREKAWFFLFTLYLKKNVSEPTYFSDSRETAQKQLQKP